MSVSAFLERFKKGEDLIARSNYRSIYKCFDKDTGMLCAWHEIAIDENNNGKGGRDVRPPLQRMVTILKELRSPVIMQHYGAMFIPNGDTDEDKGIFVFITELLVSGTLEKYISNIDGLIPRHVYCRWARTILRALEDIHSKSIIHGSLSTSSVFVNGAEGDCKVGDLGMCIIRKERHRSILKKWRTPVVRSSQIQNNQYSMTILNSQSGSEEMSVSDVVKVRLSAPELLCGTESSYSDNVDIYSFGLILLETITKKKPFTELFLELEKDDAFLEPEENKKLAVFKIQEYIHKRILEVQYPEALKDVPDKDMRRLIKKCLDIDPKKRPTIKAIINSGILTEPSSDEHTSDQQSLESDRKSELLGWQDSLTGESRRQSEMSLDVPEVEKHKYFRIPIRITLNSEEQKDIYYPMSISDDIATSIRNLHYIYDFDKSQDQKIKTLIERTVAIKKLQMSTTV